MNALSNNIALKWLKPILRIATRSSMLNLSRDYQSDGPTTAHIMNKDESVGLMIDGYSQVGFKLNNKITVLGPMVLFQRSVLAWNISDISDVTEDSLCLFKVLVPKIDILILGTGDKVQNPDLNALFAKLSREHKISFEILPTESACPTFNFLNAEGRNVVGAFLPPLDIHVTDDDQLRTKIRYENVFAKQYK